MGKTGGYKDLIAWQKAMDLVEAVYRASGKFPSEERFGLTSPVRRAVVSIPSNIAEGYARSGRNDYLRFLNIARGSANEVETQILVAARLEFTEGNSAERLLELIDEVQRILKGLVKRLKI